MLARLRVDDGDLEDPDVPGDEGKVDRGRLEQLKARLDRLRYPGSEAWRRLDGATSERTGGSTGSAGSPRSPRR